MQQVIDEEYNNDTKGVLAYINQWGKFPNEKKGSTRTT